MCTYSGIISLNEKYGTIIWVGKSEDWTISKKMTGQKEQEYQEEK